MTAKEYSENILAELRAIEPPDERTLAILQQISVVSNRLARNLMAKKEFAEADEQGLSNPN